jgi:hypothetical protein
MNLWKLGAVLLLLAGCATTGIRDTWTGPASPFQAAHNHCVGAAATAYVPFVVEMFGGHNIRWNLCKDCMAKAGYTLVRTDAVDAAPDRTCGLLNRLCRMRLPELM